ncbi:hypothetical protein A0H81_13290 [Grifola frondosa]|uniref:DUF6534 domain-containing protein n=1 Tax=Grifola frondosa TaxID=5627 RepID=A0A1C7LQ73_GRIFR|nr:hypothetical protein A0H81_13290 [Grifola frondosa]
MAEIDDLMGALLVGVFVACVLYGITTLQVFMYIQTFPGDPSFLKFMVALVWIMETVHTALCTQFIYVYVIRHFGDHEFLATIYWNAGLIVFSGVLIQLMLLRQAGMGFEQTITLYYCAPCIACNISLRFRYRWNSSLLYVPQMVHVDGEKRTAACSQCRHRMFSLYRRHSGNYSHILSGSRTWKMEAVCFSPDCNAFIKFDPVTASSNGMLTSLIVYIVNTGALTSVCSILIVITFSVQKDSLIFFALIEISSKHFLHSLNTRQHIRNKLSGNVQYPAIDLSSGSQSDAAPQSRIEVFQETVVVDDTLGLVSIGKCPP